MDTDLEELQAVESTLKGIQDLQEEVIYDQEELNDVYNTLKGIERLMGEMEIPSLEELNKIYSKLVAIKEAQED